MVNITFIEHDGTEHTIEAESDRSLMQVALDNLVPGIDADCGGECSCATCHVIVSDEWFEKVGPPGSSEASMLALTPELSQSSRLSCQIKINSNLDGLRVRLPEFQM